MTPSIGRIVHYVAQTTCHGPDHYAAMITHVWSDTCVNLFVFPKASPDDGRDTGIKTSVVLAPESVDGAMPGFSWHWPEREQ